MNRWIVLAGVALMLLVPAASAGPWGQPGHDAAATGAPDIEGPLVGDRAFSLELPGQVPDGPLVFLLGAPAEPVVLDRTAYVAVEPADGEERDHQGIVRVDLDTAEVDRFIETERFPYRVSSDTERLFVTQRGFIDAFAVDTGEHLWRALRPDAYGCLAPVVHDGVLFAPCVEDDDPDVEGTDAEAPNPISDAGGVLVALDTETGEELWAQNAFQMTDTSRPVEGRNQQAPLASAGASYILGVSHTGSGLFAVTVEPSQLSFCEINVGIPEATTCQSYHETTFTLWSLDPATGQVLWTNETRPYHQSIVRNDGIGESEQPHDDPFPPFSSRVTGGDQLVYVKLDGRLTALNPDPGGPQEVWSRNLGQEEIKLRQDCAYELNCWIGADAGSALGDGAVYTASNQLVHRFDTEAREIIWRTPIAADERLAKGSLTLADDVLYAMATAQPDARFTAFYAFDAESGDHLWRHELAGPMNRPDLASANGFAYGLAEGSLVSVDTDGWFHAIGRTNASLGAPPVETELYPPTGRSVALEVPQPEPGAMGPATRYMVDWGDGTVTDWQEDPVFTHTYDEEGEVTARVIAGNDANQTSSSFVTMNVGEETPTEPTWLSQRFEPDNQDMTFGVLGILVAVTGGAVGVTQRYRKRSRLQDELEAIDEAYAATHERPMECEAQLNERKAYARGLVLNGELDEQQFSVIEQRIEELLKGIRMGAMEDEFDFLPYGLVKRAREMLADGTVSSLEREAFLQAVEEDDVLSSDQTAAVRERIEAWHARDRQGGGSG